MGRVAIKWFALTAMLLQNAAFVLIMRYSRVQQQQPSATSQQYNVSMVVVMQETFKLVVCYLVQAWMMHAPVRAARLVFNPAELSRLAVPALCFTLQNNILYVALSNLHPLVFQITYQVKTILTAVLSVKMLGKSLTHLQWMSQLLLTVGIVLVQCGEQAPQRRRAAEAREGSLLLGLAAVLIAAFSSSFASVYFERLLKGTSFIVRDGGKEIGSSSSQTWSATSSLWHKNMQLCAWTVPSNVLLAVLQSSTTEAGALDVLREPTRGFEWSTWGVVVVNGIGGLLVAVVIKYADNIWKGFATAGAIVLTGILAPVLGLGSSVTLSMLAGAVIVIVALLMYAKPPGLNISIGSTGRRTG
ncbi:hypothetical protein AB1Y20_019121 [Prymnesium parvum]|uniref:CMP-sialic acid transporter n=1 Tax=Prymnesium parvum TaxID=97485 RepID=A0AB34JTK0_PRYPA